uniref:ribonuclease E n=1 Tax=Cryptomonas pyrenoidifera TaxID=233184 RepID=UPI0022A7B38E|nr:ribonuclease E [Cryptomonas pyrenoidifera]UZS90680.1 ribonuclease E [Cryptomonas pyrenoidifera]
MNYTLIIIEKSRIGLIYFNNKLISINMEHSIYKLHDIYLGKISTILPSLDAAFIILNPLSKNGFISFEQLKEKNQFHNIKSNKSILVQITREPIGTKGPSVSCDISLIGKYIILLPFSESVNLTRKVSVEIDKDYSKAISHLLIKPETMGIVTKPSIIQANVDFLIKETRTLTSKWKKIILKSRVLFKPSLVSKRKSFLSKILEDYSAINFQLISVDSFKTAEKTKLILSTVKRFQKKKHVVIEYHPTEYELIKHYLIDIVFTEIMRPRVNLHKGGHIVIEKTEALTTIDVNSGSFTTLNNSRQASLWVNYSAAHEIVKQIRLRNIGGIIIIDFIDSINHLDQIKLLNYINKLTKKDSVKCTIIQMSELGLVEMTRTRYGQSVYDAFSRKCNICNGLGYLTTNLTKINSSTYELILTNIPKFNKKIHDRIQILYN